VLESIVALALRHRRLVLVLALALAAWGVRSARSARLDVLPDFAPPLVVIQTEAPGFAPEQVEQLVSQPVEALIGGVVGIDSLRSESIQGLSVVTVVFSEDTDVYRARQALSESLGDLAARLPVGARPPRLSPLTSATMDVLKIGLVSHLRSPLELRRFADAVLRPRLLMVPGVARVNIFGGDVAQLRVEVEPEALQARGLAFSDVANAARAAVAVRGGGFVDTPGQRLVVEPARAAVRAEELASAPLVRAGSTSGRLGDVAAVTEAAAPKFGDALVQGESGVLLTLSAAYGSNTLEVTGRTEEALAELGPTFEREGIEVYPRLHRPASFVESALGNLRRAAWVGAGLVVVALFAFLQTPGAVLVSLTAIPLSLLFAVSVLSAFGVTVNTMSLGGLAIAIGEVVDDAIVDVENIVKRLRENERASRPRSAFAVVLQASLEVRRAVVFGTLATALVFLPLLALHGLQGKFFAPLALSYLLAVLSSLGVALVVTPALSLVVFGRRPPALDEPRLQARLKAAYRRFVERVFERPRPAVAGVASVCLAALAALPFLGGEFLPAFREGHLVLQVASVPGTSLDEMLRIGRGISRSLLAMPDVGTVEQQVGRAEQGEDTWGPERSEFHVELRSAAGHSEARAAHDVRELLEAVPGIRSEVLTFLGDRISETLTGETAEVVVNVFGDDLALLDAKAADVARTLAGVPGAVDVSPGESPTAPHLAIRLRSEALQRYGLEPVEVLDQIQAAFAGVSVGQVQQVGLPVDVVVFLSGGHRHDPARVAELLVRGTAGAAIPLGELADVDVRAARDVVLHEGGRRRAAVTCNVEGRDVASFVAEARRRLDAEVKLPAGAYLTLGGTAQARLAASRDLRLRAGFGVLGIVVLLALVARHARNLGLLLLNLPLAAAGGVLGVLVASLLRGVPAVLSLGSLVGFVTVLGITTRNAIMMVSHFRALVEEEGQPWSLETARRGATDRVVPILMTALVTGLGLLPVALAADRPGGEIDGPMAIVILGGLVTSTALNLFLLPVLCHRFGRFETASASLPDGRGAR
jgi:CzcA family heavy metal efflux pump